MSRDLSPVFPHLHELAWGFEQSSGQESHDKTRRSRHLRAACHHALGAGVRRATAAKGVREAEKNLLICGACGISKCFFLNQVASRLWIRGEKTWGVAGNIAGGSQRVFLRHRPMGRVLIWRATRLSVARRFPRPNGFWAWRIRQVKAEKAFLGDIGIHMPSLRARGEGRWMPMLLYVVGREGGAA